MDTNSIERVGKTVEDAVEMALEVLKVSRDEVEVRVIDEGSKVFWEACLVQNPQGYRLAACAHLCKLRKIFWRK